MNGMKYRTWLVAGIVALPLAGAPLIAAAQDAKTTPEWQQYDKLDTRYGPLAWLTYGQVIGSEVVDKQGDKVGEIVGLVRAKSDGMFYTLLDADGADGAGDQVVPVDHLEVVGDNEQDRQIVLVGEDTSDFDEADFEAAAPSEENKTEGWSTATGAARGLRPARGPPLLSGVDCRAAS